MSDPEVVKITRALRAVGADEEEARFWASRIVEGRRMRVRTAAEEDDAVTVSLPPITDVDEDALRGW